MLARATLRTATILLRSTGSNPSGLSSRPVAVALRRLAVAGSARRAVPASAAAAAAATPAACPTATAPTAAPAVAAAVSPPPPPVAPLAGLAAAVASASTASFGRGWLLTCGRGLDDDGV
ncbi:hypothetical protein MMPV_009009 [Pyropia vietnamensis]